jgi:hypothetical protein
MEAMMRAPGRFDAAVDIDSSSAVDQLIAFNGRTSLRARRSLARDVRSLTPVAPCWSSRII